MAGPAAISTPSGWQWGMGSSTSLHDVIGWHGNLPTLVTFGGVNRRELGLAGAGHRVACTSREVQQACRQVTCFSR